MSANIHSVLGDPAWTFVAAMVALVAVGVTIYIYKRGRPRKALVFRTSSSAVVNVSAEMAGRVTVSFDGQPVGAVHVVTVTVTNAGNTPIERTDFDGALVITLGSRGDAISVDVGETMPDSLEPHVQMHGHELTVAPLLLNPGDFFAVSALATNYEGRSEVSGRISGVKDIGREPSTSAGKQWSQTGVTAGVVLTTIVALVASVVSIVGLGTAHKTHTRLTLASGATLCAKQFRAVDAKPDRLLAVLTDGGIATVLVTDIRGIETDSC